MTYSSRNFLISWGTGSEVRAPPRASNLLSSAMMSLQTSTHSSQMKTVGPAISLRTSFWSLLQNEQRRISPSPAFLTMGYQFPVASPQYRISSPFWRLETGDWKRVTGALSPLPDDIVNNTVFLALVGPHDVVPLRVILDALQRLPRVVRQDLVQPFAGPEQLPRMNIDIGRLSAQPLHPRLMDEDA